MLLTIAFWSAAAFVLYAYAGYPLALWLIGLCRTRSERREFQSEAFCPTVTFVIAAHNEERRLPEKLQNTLTLEYPRSRLQVIVASDCSTDATDEIARSYSSDGVTLVRATERKGKENAQRLAVEAATGEVIVFSDVATILQPDGVQRIVRGFADPTVGCVSSVDRFIEADGKVSGEGAYVRYEMLLRRLETRANTLVGLSGSFFAARRAVCTPWATDLPSDFNTVLNSVRHGLRGISDPESVGYYRNIADEKKEYSRKVRTVLRGISTLMRSLSLLNPWTYGLFSWQLFSHKLCRWLVPFALLLALVSNSVLAAKNPLYLATLSVQAVFYAAGVVGIAAPMVARAALVKIPAFFLIVNMSIVSAWWRYAKGERRTLWTPSQR
ncbi:MAG TPA: glycosyltransferase family 2 protein [bacterium]